MSFICDEYEVVTSDSCGTIETYKLEYVEETNTSVIWRTGLLYILYFA